MSSQNDRRALGGPDTGRDKYTRGRGMYSLISLSGSGAPQAPAQDDRPVLEAGERSWSNDGDGRESHYSLHTHPVRRD